VTLYTVTLVYDTDQADTLEDAAREFRTWLEDIRRDGFPVVVLVETNDDDSWTINLDDPDEVGGDG
jgi:hypothetical protein